MIELMVVIISMLKMEEHKANKDIKIELYHKFLKDARMK